MPKFDPKKHHRRSIRLKDYDYSQAGAYYVTIVTWQREFLFGEIVNGEMKLNQRGKIVDECWYEIPQHFENVQLGAFVIMPNHVHGIIFIVERRGAVIAPDEKGENKISENNKMVDETLGGETPPLRKFTPTLGQIIAYFKYQSTKQMNASSNTGVVTKFWQRNYGACPEPVEGNTSSAMKKIYKTKPITLKQIPCYGMKMMKTQLT